VLPFIGLKVGDLQGLELPVLLHSGNIPKVSGILPKKPSVLS